MTYSSNILNSKDLFVIDNNNKLYLYAPLAGIISEIDEDEISKFESQILNNNISDELSPMLVSNIIPSISTPEQIDSITILINQKCNFSCLYCYSANGRNNTELDSALFSPITEWFVSAERVKLSDNKCLTVTFSGGGDPTLSMDKVKELIGMFRCEADKKNVKIRFAMVCNGSKLSDSDIGFIKDNIQDIVISFDVLKAIHQKQRSHYDIVAGTIKRLCDSDISIGLRSTITKLNVNLLDEMIDELHTNFPRCCSLAMEVVLAPEMWENVEELRSFYADFEKNFFQARRLADSYGISVGNTVVLSAEALKTRACMGKVVVTPEGALTACSRVATHGDMNFNDFMFGRVGNNGVIVDALKYAKIMNYNADYYNECQCCFAKYHCGGGCLLTRHAYNSDAMLEHCNFVRNMIKRELLYELD